METTNLRDSFGFSFQPNQVQEVIIDDYTGCLHIKLREVPQKRLICPGGRAYIEFLKYHLGKK